MKRPKISMHDGFVYLYLVNQSQVYISNSSETY